MKPLKLIIMLCFAATIVSAQTQQLSLKQAVDYALSNNSNVKNAQLDETIAKQKVNEITGLGTPQISGSAEVNHFLEIPTTFVPAEFAGGEPGEFIPFKFGTPYNASVGIAATQLLFDGSYLVGLQASRAYQDLSRKTTAQSKIVTAVTVTKAYYFVLVTKEQINMASNSVERLKKQKDDIKASYDQGLSEKLDYDRIELVYNNSVVSQKNAERMHEIAYLSLKLAMGMDQKTQIELTDKLDEGQWSNMNLPETADPEKRNEFSILQSAHRLQELDLKRYRSAYLPSLAAFGSLSTNASRNEFSIFNTAYKWYPTAIVGARLSIPLWDGLQRESKIQQSKLALKKSGNSLESMKQFFSVSYSTSKMALENSLATLETSKKNRELAKEIVRASKLKFDNGIGSSLDVVEAESSLKDAESIYFTSLFQVIAAKIDTDQALGNITY